MKMCRLIFLFTGTAQEAQEGAVPAKHLVLPWCQQRPIMHYSTRSKMGALVDAYLSRHDPEILRSLSYRPTRAEYR
jgi:hypothetical protein